jgi:hypothetical protein
MACLVCHALYSIFSTTKNKAKPKNERYSILMDEKITMVK